MKLLFVLTYYYPHWTGLTQYAQRVAEGLAKKGHQAKVLTTQHEPKLKNEEVVSGVKVLRKPVLFRLSRTLISPALLFSLWQEFGKNDAAIVYLPLAEVGLVALMAKILGKKLFLVHNGDLVLPKGFINKFMEKFYFLSTSFAIWVSQAILIQSEDYAFSSKLLSKHKNKWQVILPLYDLKKPTKEMVEALKSKGNLDKKHVVGFAGRFVSEKGFDFLLKAIPLVIAEMPNTVFAFAGETQIPYENFYQQNASLIKKVDKHLRFLGLLNSAEMAAFFKLCSILVISSRTDCFPSAEVEALLHGVPVVVTDIPGARWPVKTTGMGEVVKAGSEKALADGIIKVLKNAKSYQERKEQVERIFDYDKTLKSYETVFKQGN